MSNCCVWNSKIPCTRGDRLREFSRQIAEASAVNDGRLWLEGAECPSVAIKCPKYNEYMNRQKQR